MLKPRAGVVLCVPRRSGRWRCSRHAKVTPTLLRSAAALGCVADRLYKYCYANARGLTG